MDNNGVGQVSNDNPLSGRILRNRVGAKASTFCLLQPIATNCNQLQNASKNALFRGVYFLSIIILLKRLKACSG